MNIFLNIFKYFFPLILHSHHIFKAKQTSYVQNNEINKVMIIKKMFSNDERRRTSLLLNGKTFKQRSIFIDITYFSLDLRMKNEKFIFLHCKSFWKLIFSSFMSWKKSKRYRHYYYWVLKHRKIEEKTHQFEVLKLLSFDVI